MHGISVIVPTIGRPESLEALLESLRTQTRRPDQVLVADASDNDRVMRLVAEARWRAAGLAIEHLRVTPPNAVGQREAAIARATGEVLLLLDDDVVLERDCVRSLEGALDQSPQAAAAVADMNNETWPDATPAWRWYLTTLLGMRNGEWHGRVVGPLLRFGYPPHPSEMLPMEWFSTSNTMVRRSAFDAAGGFSTFFLHRSTMNEDVDLSIKIARHGAIVVCPQARLAHHHHPSGRVSVFAAAEDDLYNRYLILRRTLGRSRTSAFGSVTIFFLIETLSNVIGAMRRLQFDGLFSRAGGRASALLRICTGQAA
jgi:GT2 family glycosyltransferase